MKQAASRREDASDDRRDRRGCADRSRCSLTSQLRRISLPPILRAMKRLLPFVLFLAACARAYAADPQPVHVFVVGTTDRHGWYDSHHESKTAPAYGGLPLIAGYLRCAARESWDA